MKQLTPVAIGLGSNLGDRLATITGAMDALAEDLLEGALGSSIYESPPWGYAEQPDFLNAVIVGDSEWKPAAIVNYLKELERKLGRQPSTIRWGPRALDLDLLAWGNHVVDDEGLSVPHPRMAERDFVLLPLRELWPHWRHPKLGRTVRELCTELAAKGPLTAKVLVGTMITSRPQKGPAGGVSAG